MRGVAFCLAFGVYLLSPVALAETLYVTDQLTVRLRADASREASVVGTDSTGAALEVLERKGSFVHVRDDQGTEGWVEAGVLASQPPAARQVKTLRAELDRTRSQLAKAQALLEKSRTAPAADTNKIQAELTAVRAQLGRARTELQKKDEEITAAAAARDAAVKEADTLRQTVASATKVPEVVAPTPAAPPETGNPAVETGFGFLWLGIGFAMLVVGFIGGIVWVKESIRRRMGGMYLRI